MFTPQIVYKFRYTELSNFFVYIYIYIALKTLPLNDKQQTRRKYLTELIDVYETST